MEVSPLIAPISEHLSLILSAQRSSLAFSNKVATTSTWPPPDNVPLRHASLPLHSLFSYAALPLTDTLPRPTNPASNVPDTSNPQPIVTRGTVAASPNTGAVTVILPSMLVPPSYFS